MSIIRVPFFLSCPLYRVYFKVQHSHHLVPFLVLKIIFLSNKVQSHAHLFPFLVLKIAFLSNKVQSYHIIPLKGPTHIHNNKRYRKQTQHSLCITCDIFLCTSVRIPHGGFISEGNHYPPLHRICCPKPYEARGSPTEIKKHLSNPVFYLV